MREIRAFLLVAAVVFLAGAGECFAQVRTFVSPNGVDTNPCTLQQPCRNFAAAMTAVAAGGEVVALSSGGYGAVTINQSVSLIAPEGVHAAIAPTVDDAVTVAALDTDRVVIRNLYLNSQGGAFGIQVDSVVLLVVERTVVSGFLDAGIRFNPTTLNAHLLVTDTTVRECGDDGIVIAGTSTRAAIESVRAQRNGASGIASFVPTTIRRSEASGNGTQGFYALVDSMVAIEDSIATGNGQAGFSADGMMSISRCASTFNQNGVLALIAAGVAYVSDSTIVGNSEGIRIQAGGSAFSRGNNTLQNNGTDGTFSSGFTAK